MFCRENRRTKLTCGVVSLAVTHCDLLVINNLLLGEQGDWAKAKVWAQLTYLKR